MMKMSDFDIRDGLAWLLARNRTVAASFGAVELSRRPGSYGRNEARAERWLMPGHSRQKQPQDEVPADQGAGAKNGERASRDAKL